MVNSFGGQWFDMSWKPQLETKPWKDAVTFYVDLLKKYGPPGSSANSFNEILALYNEGKCGMWIDATIAASFITDPKQQGGLRTGPEDGEAATTFCLRRTRSSPASFRRSWA